MSSHSFPSQKLLRRTPPFYSNRKEIIYRKKPLSACFSAFRVRADEALTSTGSHTAMSPLLRCTQA